ncbi:LCP family protein [Blastococcus sp. KM273128]|uniref:LCP family protein n=1 Tax=Blastococcus sp. KM273128 TaxID=2570314 RepID=UPI001F2F3D23|nr:LCP family protein [Blastococcus sp. KM273128]
MALVALLVLLGIVAVDAAVVAARVDRLDVDLAAGPGDADGRTWVLIGLDSRERLPDGADVRDFGTPEAVPGSRADVVLVVHQTDAGTTAFSIPRDLVVIHGRSADRLALTWLDGPQATVAALCGIGIPTDHLVTVDLAGFAAVVDAAGGMQVDVPQPVRDPAAGLLLETAGRTHVDGATALALVRSRHPEHLVDGAWVPAPVDPDGRASAAGAVLAALADRVRASGGQPWRLQAIAWSASDAVATDPGTALTDLLDLALGGLGEARVLPVGDPAGGGLARPPTAETTAAIAGAGLSCDG